MLKLIRREPVAFVTLLGSLAASSVPLMLILGVSAHTVELVGAAVPGWTAALGAFARSSVTPNSQVALTHEDVAALQPPPPLPPG